MKNILLITLFILALFSVKSLSVSVVDLKDDTYDKEVKGNQISFIMLYAPWCGYCTTFKPIFEEAASKSDKFFFGRVDCTVEGKLCQRLKVNYYPTLTVFKYGHATNFNGERTANGIIETLEQASRYNGTVLNTAEEIADFSKNNKYHAIAYFSNQDTQGFRNFAYAAERRVLYQTPIALVTDSALFDGRKDGTIDVFNTQTHNPIVLAENAEISYDTILNLSLQMFQNSFPLVIHIDDDNYSRYRQGKKNIYLAWIDLKDENKDANIKILEDAARAFPQFAFGYVDYNEKKERLYKLGAVRQQVNTILRIDFNSEDSFIYEHPQPFTVEGISKWINGIISGDVKPNILTELVPEVNDGPVYKVVGSTFDQIVLDPTKDVFIQYYIDWCEGCKYLESFDKVGQALKGIEDVVVAKVDYNINDLPNINLQIYGNPTLAVYPRDNKKNPIVYSGTQGADDLLRFFKKHTTSKQALAVADLPKEDPPKYPFDDFDQIIDVDGTAKINVKHDEL